MKIYYFSKPGEKLLKNTSPSYFSIPRDTKIEVESGLFGKTADQQGMVRRHLVIQTQHK
jgi:hypothetical protein